MSISKSGVCSYCNHVIDSHGYCACTCTPQVRPSTFHPLPTRVTGKVLDRIREDILSAPIKGGKKGGFWATLFCDHVWEKRIGISIITESKILVGSGILITCIYCGKDDVVEEFICKMCAPVLPKSGVLDAK